MQTNIKYQNRLTIFGSEIDISKPKGTKQFTLDTQQKVIRQYFNKKFTLQPKKSLLP